MNQMTPFQFGTHSVRVITNEKGEPLFVGKDVCNALGYTDTVNAIKQHCKGVAIYHPIPDSIGRIQETRVIAEPDMMRLVSHCALPAGVAFEKLIYEDILPTIRKTGSYTDPQAQPMNVLSPAMAQQLSVMLKAQMEGMVRDSLPQLIHGAIAASHASVRHGITAGQIMETYGLQKIKGGAQHLSRCLVKLTCLIDGSGRAEMGTRTAKLFDPDKVRAQMKIGGMADQYKKYVQERKGQGNLFAVRPAL